MRTDTTEEGGEERLKTARRWIPLALTSAKAYAIDNSRSIGPVEESRKQMHDERSPQFT
jgi:hypothetical protein